MKNCLGSSTHSAKLLDSPSINPKLKKHAFNTPRELIEGINALGKEKIVSKGQHLGIILTSEEHNMEQANYEFLQPRLEAAMKRVTLWNHSTYTRALLAESILHSQANHTLMAIQLPPVHLNGIQKIINKS